MQSFFLVQLQYMKYGSKNITFVLLKGFPTDFENHFYNVDVEFFNEQMILLILKIFLH